MPENNEGQVINYVPEGAIANAIREDEARLNVTWGGQNADMPDPVPRDATDADIKTWVTEAVRGDGLPGLTADPAADFGDFVVDRFGPTEQRPFNLIQIRPKVPFGLGDGRWGAILDVTGLYGPVEIDDRGFLHHPRPGYRPLTANNGAKWHGDGKDYCATFVDPDKKKVELWMKGVAALQKLLRATLKKGK